nr:hypothetical protein BaRGS_010727 [Batillaria attramentaria]
MQNKDVTVGINIAGISYYSAEVKWVDIAKQSHKWVTHREGVSDWDTHEADKISWRDDGRKVVEFPHIKENGIILEVTATNPDNPIHNIRVLPPGYENTYERFPFHPLFLEFLKRFSEIRFMDYLHTNGHGPEPTTWSTRRRPDYHTQEGPEGGAVEYMVQLANTVGVDPWICVPFAADDHYVTQLASYVKKNLRPDVKVYVEYSNEVWNTMFRQTIYTQEQGKLLFPDDNARTAGMKFFVKRATEIANLWTQVWGSESERVVNVIAWQTNYFANYNRMLAELGDRKSSFQAIGITGYFTCDKATRTHAAEMPTMTMAEIQHLCDVGLAHEKDTDRHYMDVALAHGLKLVMYEGGPGMANPDNAAVTDKAIAFNKDQHIQRPVEDVMEAWYDIVTSNGSNSSPGQDLSQVPKWLGVQTFISQHWPNNPLGPKCSFVKDPTTDTAYGCFKSGQHYVCAKSADDGRTWTMVRVTAMKAGNGLPLNTSVSGTVPVQQVKYMQNKDVTVGINIGGISYYSSEVKWVDIAKQSKTWLTQRDGVSEWDTHEIDKISLRDDGRMVVEFPNIKDNGIELKITGTNPHNPIHNIRIIPPGYENTYERFPFHPLFLEFLKRFSEIRFMDYLHTNGHMPEPTTWDDRKTTDFHTHAGEDGGSIEYLVQLVNTLGTDAWVCMPHAADDNYVRQFATYVKKNLRPDLKVYVEYFNEVWNSNFRQTHYTQEQGKLLYPDDNDRIAGMKFFVKRATEIADIWTHVWGSQSGRVVNVIAWQTNWFGNYDQMLSELGDRKSSFDAMAITGYFNCDKVTTTHASEMPTMTMAQIQHLCDVDLANEKNTDRHYMDVALAHGLKLVMYEGGPGMVNQRDSAVTDKAIAFNRDQHIQRPVEDVLEAWYDIVTSNHSNGSPGGLFNYFASTGMASKYGSWGMAEYTGQDLSHVPKWLGVQTFISRHWPNNPLGPKCSFVKDPATNTAYGCFKPGQHYVCAKSANNGRTWTNLPSLHQADTDHLTLDGFDPDAKKLYVRVTDKTDVITYHVYSEHSHHWTTYVS